MHRRQFLPIGTVTLTTCFHADSAMLATQGEYFVYATAKALSFRDDYFDQTAEVWSADHHLLASSHQSVYFRDQ